MRRRTERSKEQSAMTSFLRVFACVVLTVLAVLAGARPAVAAVSVGSSPAVSAPACVPDALGARMAAAPRPAAQVRHLDRAEITFHASLTQDGAVQVEGRGAEFVFRKKSRPNGHFTLDLEGPDDKVGISLAEDSATITRGRRRVTLLLRALSERDLDEARVLLAGSSAVRLARVAAAAVQDSEDDSAAAVSLLISDALVGMLSGDAGAPGRIARHLARHGRAGIRRAATTDCYGDWERKVLAASYEWESCASAFSVWNPIRNVCAFRWTLQVESYWFSFLSCTGFNSF
jgi:hypothetical protein